MSEELTAVEQRVIGVLLEKERTVPDTYPMTLNGVITASSQSSGRDPVMSLTETDVTRALDSLRQRQLTRRVLPSHGARTEKYRQVADEVWQLDDAERAVLTLLLLRGPQTPGELRSRSGRLHDFADLDAVHAALRGLAGRDRPFAAQLDREPGRKERRWKHLLGADEARSDAAAGGTPAAVSPADLTATDPAPLHRDVEPLRPLIGTWIGSGRGSYPTIAAFGYDETIRFDAVAGKPFLAYRSTTTAADDRRPLHAEVGWLRVAASTEAVEGELAVELVVAQAPGLLEATEGIAECAADRCHVVMSSSVTAATTTAKRLDATEREYLVDGDELSYRVSMAAVDRPLQPHLGATLRRSGRVDSASIEQA